MVTHCNCGDATMSVSRALVRLLLLQTATFCITFSKTLTLPSNSAAGLLDDDGDSRQFILEEKKSNWKSIKAEMKTSPDLSSTQATAESPHLLHLSPEHRSTPPGPPPERTSTFVVVDGYRRSLREALQNGHPEKLHCGLQVGGRIYFLDLEKNSGLLPSRPDIFYYLHNGTGVSEQTSPVAQCFYHGTVRGFPQSSVAVSTCAGLRGVVAVNSTLSFELQPAGKEEQDEEEGVCLLYPSPQDRPSVGGCGVSNTPVPPLHIPLQAHRSKRDLLSETKYIELVLVADHKEYLNYQKDNETIIYRMLDIANQVDAYYRALNVRVALTGLEIWSDRDKIQVNKSPIDTLNRFLEWRTRELLPRLRHDNAQLIMGESFDGTTVGMASQSSMCSKDRSGGVNVDHLVSIYGVASTVAHELGHNLGMNHDTAERRCQCQNEARLGGCIMEPSTGFMPGQLFSSCSAQDLSLSLLHGGGMCLFNVPEPERLRGGQRCGNFYVEKGEQCDCGLLEECKDPCCNASTCQLVPGAQCSSDGICCDNCKLRSAGWVCREPLGECDLPEHCTGSSPYCPPNVFLQNGAPCEGGSSHCHSGVCASLHAQCQTLWGANATKAAAVCFSSVNKQGNKYGNCGQQPNGSYVPCSGSDVHCGRIQCQGGNDRPLLGTNAEILTTKVRLNHSDFVCRGTFFDLGDDVSDPAMVAQGTACGPGKACWNQKCQDVLVFGVEECQSKCNGRGVCNSNKKCHCEVGWAPPDCLYAGHGGSEDSGPARADRVSDPVRVALFVIFLFILPVLLLFLIVRYPHCRRSLLCLGGASPFHKVGGRQQSRTPATERVDARNGDQVRPLRYNWNRQSDIPLTSPSDKAPVQPKPPAPKKPLPLDPPSHLVQSGKPLPLDPPSHLVQSGKPLPLDPPSRLVQSGKPLPLDPPSHLVQSGKPLPLDPPSHLVQSGKRLPLDPPSRLAQSGKPLPLDPPSHLVQSGKRLPLDPPSRLVQSGKSLSLGPPSPPQRGASITLGLAHGPAAALVPSRRAPLPPIRMFDLQRSPV